MKVAVRPGMSGDAEPLSVAHVRAWQEGYRGLMPQDYLDGLSVAEHLTGWQERLGNPREGSRLLVGTVDDEVAGFAVFGPARDPESGDGGELYAINVHPDHWRAGVGSGLLVEVHDGLADLGHTNAVLWVVAGNDRARRFYESHGWNVEPVERSEKLPGLVVQEVRYARRTVEGEA
jgi:GNAT superfamily N-acetyltransferase